MLKFIDILSDNVVELEIKNVDYLGHCLECVKVVDVEGKTYITKLVFVEDE